MSEQVEPGKTSKRDYLIYFAIAFIVTSVAVVLGFTMPLGTEFPLGLISGFGFTCTVFGYVIFYESRKNRTRPAFWVICVLFLTVHLVIYYFFVFRELHPPLLLWGLSIGPEYWIISMTLEFLLQKPGTST